MSLNHAQTEAVAHNEGPCMVLAGPGSGKTLTIAKRIEYLIMKYKVRPEEILVITFTKYAAQEMKERTRRICGPSSYAVTFGTFHGIYYGILKWAYRLDCLYSWSFHPDAKARVGKISKASSNVFKCLMLVVLFVDLY